MPGTAAGGVKTANKNKELYGSDYYVKIGGNGGRKSRGGGFSAAPDKAKPAGHKGGTKSGLIRRAKRDDKLALGWRFQDKHIKPPHELDTSRAVYVNHKSLAIYRDRDWDAKHAEQIKKKPNKRKYIRKNKVLDTEP